MEVNDGTKMESVMSSCNDCLVDMICIKECPFFEVDIKRLQRDEKIYLKRCMNNIKNETSYQISENIEVKICDEYIWWYKNGKVHRDNDNPAAIYLDGGKVWCKNGEIHRDNNPAAIYPGGRKYWYKNGVEYEPM